MGLLFLGTPHHGADIAAWGTYALNIVNTVKRANTYVVETLRPDSEMLRNVQQAFAYLREKRMAKSKKLEVTCFFEELPLHGIVVSIGIFSLSMDDLDCIRLNSSINHVFALLTATDCASTFSRTQALSIDVDL